MQSTVPRPVRRALLQGRCPSACAAAWLFLAPLLAACPPAPPDDSRPDTTEDSTPDTGGGFFSDIGIELAEAMPTVATVRWQTEAPARCRVSFGAPGAEPVLTPLEATAATEHQAVLVGLRQSTEIQVEIYAEGEHGSHASAPSTFTTGALDISLRALTLSADDPTRSAGGFTLVPITTSAGGTWGSWACILDPAGEILWAYPAAAAPRMRLSPDGSGITCLYELVDGSKERKARLARVSWTGEELWGATIPAGQRDFAILDSGDLAVLAQVSREVEGYPEPLVGDQIQVVPAEGEARVIWDSFERFPPGWCDVEPLQTDWTHANYLAWSAQAGELLVVLRTLSAVEAIDPADGSRRWVLSNRCGDYVSADGSALVVNPHSAEPTEQGLLLFNQGEEPDGCSGAVELALDPDAGTARATWSYDDPDCIHTYFMGNAQALPNGNRLIVLNGQISEVAASGEVIHQIKNPLDQTFGYAERVPTLYVTP